MKFSIRIAAVLLGFGMTSQAFAMGAHAPTYAPLDTVKNVDLNAYLGKWYEIARLPQIFEKDCVGVTAEYSAMAEGKIRVVNTCRKEYCGGKVNIANGVGRSVDAIDNSKLKVSFFWPFEGDYWILKLDSDYRYAVVGSPDRKSLWILSRTPGLDRSIVNEIFAEFAAKGFATGKMIQTISCEN